MVLSTYYFRENEGMEMMHSYEVEQWAALKAIRKEGSIIIRREDNDTNFLSLYNMVQVYIPVLLTT